MTRRNPFLTSIAILLASAGGAIGSAASAQCPAPTADRAAPPAPRIQPPVGIWPGAQPDLHGWAGLSETPVTESTSDDGKFVFNVTHPSFQAFLPAAGCATGAGVIVAPGGGFRLLSIRNEGTDVARWLAEHGVAAFVLKYRLVQDPTRSLKRPASLKAPDETLGQPGVEDGIQALRVIRAHAADYGVDPKRIGAIGFSAGAHVVSMMAIAPPPAERPDFVAPIYGGPFLQVMPKLPPANLPYPPGTPTQPWLAPKPVAAPGALPPIFLAAAQDDALAGTAVRAFYDALYQAGYRPELHYYLRGGHGFGMAPQGSTSDHFLQEFDWWIDSLGMTRK